MARSKRAPADLSREVAGLVAPVREMHVRAEMRLLARLARAVERGTATDSLTAELAARRALLADLDRLLADLHKRLPEAVDEAQRVAYGAGQARTDADVAALWPRYRSPEARPAFAAAPEAVLARAAVDTSAMSLQVRRWVADAYDAATQTAAADVVTGAATRREVSREMIERLAANGITGFVDRAGRNWEMGAYAEMAARAASAQAAVQGQLDRAQAVGINEVVVSDHGEECKMCRPWEGRVLSINGDSPEKLSDGIKVAGTMADAVAAGFMHPGCRHTVTPYIPGLSQVQRRTADPEGDALRQQQRAKERAIRRTKRRLIVAEEQGKGTPAAVRLRARLDAQRKGFAEWRKEHDRKNLNYRENVKHR